MSSIPENQIQEWLNKLERESWQLELLVSAFTIFLLIGANSEFDKFLIDVQYQYNLNGSGLSIFYIFLVLIEKSIKALTISLVIHLMLRGFWIGAIGLRSVQSNIDFSKLNYNDFFTEKLKKKVISLDRMVIMLDEICSVIFAFSFLIISILIAFGMYLTLIGLSGIGLSALVNSVSGTLSTILIIISSGIFLLLIVSGMIYMIDYFTLGFFKKIRWFSRLYYPLYKFYNIITLSGLSRSIYYYMISKFSKKRIRMVYAVVGGVVAVMMFLSFDQYQYFPSTNENFLSTNVYDDQRGEDEYIETASIASSFIDKPHFQIFIRYNPSDNSLIRSHCPDFDPIKDDGLNWKLRFKTEGANFQITGIDYSREDFDQLIDCQQSIYRISINDSIYQDLRYHFFVHPDKQQKGLLTTITTDDFQIGENLLTIHKIRLDSAENPQRIKFVSIPFWFNAN